MKRSSTTQQKFTSVKWQAVCDQKSELSTGNYRYSSKARVRQVLIYDLALVRIQIHEFKSIAVARVAAQDSSNPERAARNGH